MPCIDNGAGWDGCERHTHRSGRVDGRRQVAVSQAMRDRLTTDLLAAAFHPEALRPGPGPQELGPAQRSALNPPTPGPFDEQLNRKENTHAGLYL